MKRKLLRCMCWAAALAAGLGFSHSLEARPKERKKATRKVEPFKLPSHVGRVVYRQKRMMLSLYRQLRKNKGNIVKTNATYIPEKRRTISVPIPSIVKAFFLIADCCSSAGSCAMSSGISSSS